MRINHNIASLNTYRQLTNNVALGQKSTEKLSSGMRINRAGDDAAGLAISEKMRGQIRGIDQASRNAQDGISLIQTAEGALSETHSILQRMRELAVQSANDSNTSADRNEIQKEVDQLAIEITRISNNTEFNTKRLINGGMTANGEGVNTFHIGANAGQTLSITINAMDAHTLGVARNSVSTTLAAGAKDITAASVTAGSGTALTNGASLSLSVITETAARACWGGIGGSALDIKTVCNDHDYNTVSVKIVCDGTIDACLNNGVLIIHAVCADTAACLTAATINSRLTSGATGAIQGLNNIFIATADAAGGIANNTCVGIGTCGLDTGYLKLCLTDGTNAESKYVSNTATSIAYSSACFNGLTLTADGALTATAATITVSVTLSSAATFSNSSLVCDARALAGINVSSQTAANTAISTIQTAVETVSTERAKIGAYQNRLEHTINNLSTASENLTAAESRIRDVDMAKEMMEYTKNNILMQAAQSMLAQANQSPQGVLQLLRG